MQKIEEIEMDDELTVYIIVKAMLGLVYSNEILEDFKYEEGILPIYDELNLEILCSILEKYQHNIDKCAKENVYTIVGKFREYALTLPQDRKKEIYTLTNEVLVKLNQTDDSEMASFMYDELKKRGYSKRKLMHMANDYQSTKSKTKEFYMNDLILLINHTGLITDEEFEEDIDLYSTLDPDYIASMNAILCEFPSVFKDKTFYKRVMYVCDVIGGKIKHARRKDVSDIKVSELKKLYGSYKKKLLEL